MSVFLSSLGRFPRWILSFRSSTKPPRGRPVCCLSPEPIETTTTKEREKNAYDDSKTKRVTPQSLVNSCSQREHKYILIVSLEQKTSGKEKAELHKRKTLSSLSPVSRVCVHYISPIRANSISRLKNKRRTQLRNAKNASAIIIVTCLCETNVFKLNRISACVCPTEKKPMGQPTRKESKME